MLTMYIILFFIACIGLIIGGSFLVKSLVKLSTYLGIEEFTVGFVIMAFATSLPELFIGILSALSSEPALALGNVIGSNVIDLTLVAGIAILLKKGIEIKSKKTKHDALYMSLIAFAPLILMLVGNELSRLDGLFLLIIFSLYIRRILKQRKVFRKKLEKKRIKRKSIILNTLIFVGSFVLLLVSAHYVVSYAQLIFIELLLPPIFIGLFLISIGTSLPELVFETKSVLTGHPDMAIGDIIGSVIANSTLVLGATALIYPIQSNVLLFITSGFFMFITAFLFASFIESGSKLYWKEGVALIFLYIFFLILELSINVLPGMGL